MKLDLKAALVTLTLVLAGCSEPDERVGTSSCQNVSPEAQSYMQGTEEHPVRCGPQSNF